MPGNGNAAFAQRKRGVRIKIIKIGRPSNDGKIHTVACYVSQVGAATTASAENTVSFKRIGINEAQITEFDLPTKSRKKSDVRSRHVTATVEVKAMPAHILRGILRHSIESLLPKGALRAPKIAEQSEREGLKILASHLGAP